VSAAIPPPARNPDRDTPARSRIWLYRALSLLVVPALVLGGFELGLRLGGYGRTVGFLIPGQEPGYYRSNPDFVSWFLPSSFDLRPINFRVARAKPPNTVRVVVLGESAAQGVPTPAFGFAAQLRAQLRARHPDREIEVINTGIVAINSHVVYQVAREMAAFHPDLFVVYMGNNEVVGPYGPGCAYLSQMPPLWVIRLSIFVKATRTGQWVAAQLSRFARAGRRPAEWGGMAMFVDNGVRGDDPRLEATYRNFAANLRDIVRTTNGSGARTLLCTVGCNLKDCAPFLSLHRADLGPADLAAWTKAFERGRLEWLVGDWGGARADLGAALALDPQYADTSYLLGQLDLADGNAGSARGHLLEAEHWDALRFRPDPRINAAIREVARSEPGVSLVDVAGLVGSDPASRVPPAGRELFFEHVHFDWPGNYAVARAMAEGAEPLLSGAGGGTGAWLDSGQCARALGYTDHERFSVLQHIATIIQNPPFTNQLTYVRDEARLDRELAAAEAASKDAAVLRSARAGVESAEEADPGNADLPKIAEGVDDDLGDVAAALAQARRAQELQPPNFALVTDAAIKLSRLGRFEEAERFLNQAYASAAPRDRVAMVPAYADFYARTKRFEDGRRFLDREIAADPADLGLRLTRGRLARLGGDTVTAEAEYRGVLGADPSSAPALEALVSLLEGEGRSEAAEQAVLEAAPGQPRNHANNLRAAILCDRKHDLAQSLHYLLAAERSGAVTAAIEIRMARTLFAAGHAAEALRHLGEARGLAQDEGDAATVATILQAIAQVRAQES